MTADFSLGYIASWRSNNVRDERNWVDLALDWEVRSEKNEMENIATTQDYCLIINTELLFSRCRFSTPDEVLKRNVNLHSISCDPNHTTSVVNCAMSVGWEFKSWRFKAKSTANYHKSQEVCPMPSLRHFKPLITDCTAFIRSCNKKLVHNTDISLAKTRIFIQFFAF